MEKDFEFVKEKLENAKVTLPASLSPDAVVHSLREAENTEPGEEPVKKTERVRVFRRVAASLLAAAAVFALIFGLLPRLTKPDPAKTPTDPAVTEEVRGTRAKTYDAVYNLMQKNAAIGRVSDFFSDFSVRGFLKTKNFDMDGAMPEDVPNVSPATETAGATDDKSHSELNTVEAGVDETDVIRTDGDYIYVLKNAASSAYSYGMYASWDMAVETGGRVQTLNVLAPNAGSPVLVSSVRLTLTEEGATEIAKERSYSGFYLWGNYAVLTGSETEFKGGSMRYNEEEGYWDFYGSVESETNGLVTVYDLSDKTNPTLVRDLYFSGTLADTRIVDGKLIVASAYHPDFEHIVKTEPATFIPCAGDKDDTVAPEDIVTDDGVEIEGYMTVSTADLSDLSAEVQSVSVMGNLWDLYCSKNAVYVYGSHDRYRVLSGWTGVLDVHKVDISGEKPVYIGQKSFEGAAVLNDFALNEYEGNLRLTLHYRKDWTDRETVVVVLSPDMEELGRSEAFGVGEDIKSVRYDKNLVYVVTFLNTDPLFAFDLTDPQNIVKLAEVKLPGYSAYLHPVNGYLVGVGYGGTETGVDGSAKLSLFTATPDDMKELDSLVVDNAWFNTNYKAFVPVGEDGFLVLCTRWAEPPADGEWTDEYESKTLAGWMYVKAADDKLETVASGFLNTDGVERALFIGGEVYLYGCEYRYETDERGYGVPIRTDFLTGFSMTTGETLGEVRF